MEKNELKDIVNEVIRASKEEKIPVSKLEMVLSNVLEKKLNRKLTEEEVNYIKESVSGEEVTEEIEKNYSIEELEDIFEKISFSKEAAKMINSRGAKLLFKPISYETGATPMDLINKTFEIADEVTDKGLGTYLREKEKNKCKDFDPLYIKLDMMANMFFINLSQAVSETVRENDLKIGSKEKTVLKKLGKEILTETVKINSKNMKETGNLKPEEEKFIKNINSIINKFLD